MKRKFSDIVLVSFIVIVISIIFTFSLSGCYKELDEVYDSVEDSVLTKSMVGTESTDSSSIDSIRVSDWNTEIGGKVTFSQ